MRVLNEQPEVGSLPDPSELRKLVQRVTASRQFSRAQRLRSFLEYVCERSFTGTAGAINEQSIGYDVFKRGSDFDPASDNIVRVEARELRKRLESYFSEEGRDEPVVIRIPKGRYVPVFEPRAGADPPEPAVVADSGLVGPPAGSTRPYRTLAAVLAVAATLLTALSAHLYRQNTSLRGASQPPPSAPPRTAAFWANFFQPGKEVLVILADSNFALLQDIQKRSVPFGEYSSGRYFAGFRQGQNTGGLVRILSMIASRHYTSLADVDTVARLAALNRGRSSLVIRFGRDLTPRDLRGRNAVLLGSVRSTPWVSLFEDQCRFRFGYDVEKDLPYFEDAAPPPGAPSVYLGGRIGEDPYAAYGVVASVANLDRTGGVLLVAGTNMQGTEAAAQFLLSPEKLEAFLTKAGWQEDRVVPSFEVILKLVTVGGSSVASEIVASRH